MEVDNVQKLLDVKKIKVKKAFTLPIKDFVAIPVKNFESYMHEIR